MKYILTILALLTAIPSFAASTSKVGFRAYSSDVGTTCTSWRQVKQIRDIYGRGDDIDIFAPDNDLTRTHTLGTKGFANVSTSSVSKVKFSCVATGTSTATPVKVYLNGVETHLFTVSSDTIGIIP